MGIWGRKAEARTEEADSPKGNDRKKNKGNCNNNGNGNGKGNCKGESLGYPCHRRERSTASFQRWRRPAASFAGILGSKRISLVRLARNSSVPGQQPIAKPAR